MVIHLDDLSINGFLLCPSFPILNKDASTAHLETLVIMTMGKLRRHKNMESRMLAVQDYRKWNTYVMTFFCGEEMPFMRILQVVHNYFSCIKFLLMGSISMGINSCCMICLGSMVFCMILYMDLSMILRE